LILLRKKLAKSNTNPLITNHIIRALRQYTGGFHISKIPIPDPKLDPNTIDYESLNTFFEIGVDNIISGVISSDITDVQKRYASQYNVGEKFSILSWNRSLIKALLDFSNSIWQYRSGILHDQKELSRETMIQEKAVELLLDLKRDPYRLPYDWRDLVVRTPAEILESPMAKIRS